MRSYRTIAIAALITAGTTLVVLITIEAITGATDADHPHSVRSWLQTLIIISIIASGLAKGLHLLCCIKNEVHKVAIQKQARDDHRDIDRKTRGNITNLYPEEE